MHSTGNLIASGMQVDWIVSKRGNDMACLFLQSVHYGTGAVVLLTRKDTCATFRDDVVQDWN